MHPYAADSNERKIIPLYIAGASILVAWILNGTLEAIQLAVPWWIDAPSVIGFYGMLYALFDKVLWKKKIFRSIRVVKIPDLNGTWKGYLASSFDEHATRHDATIKIFQNWTRMSITLETAYSKSHSLIAGIITETSSEISLNYEYLNEPIADAKDTMHIHRGTARLAFYPEGKVFEGEYYTGRDRRNFGLLKFERI
jgi:hypothetical protein